MCVGEERVGEEREGGFGTCGWVETFATSMPFVFFRYGSRRAMTASIACACMVCVRKGGHVVCERESMCMCGSE